jgi:hypothetical protein
VRRGLLWLALVDLRQAGPRAALAALAIGLAILAVSFFARQVELRQREILAGYEEAGAATFIVEISGILDDQIDVLAEGIRALEAIRSAEAPYRGVSLRTVADTSFLVFQNDQQLEYLGARTTLLGTDGPFDPARDYFVDFHEVNPSTLSAVLGIPLLAKDGTVGSPRRGEVLVAADVADYVGVRPGADATVELIYTGITPPITQRIDGLRLLGTFDVVGPDQGRFAPFWSFASRGNDILTVRQAEARDSAVTTLPTILDADTVRHFLAIVRQELKQRGASALLPSRTQLVVRARSINDVPNAEAAASLFLRQHGLERACNANSGAAFCLRLPERNNFTAALEEQRKVAAGGGYFVALLLLLIAAGSAGFELQTVLGHWHDFGVLQAVGFSPLHIFIYFISQLLVVLGAGITLAVIASLAVSASSISPVLAWAMAISTASALLAAVPILTWPLWRSPDQIIREAA